MNFPGENSIILTRESVKEIVRNHVISLLGDKVRITSLRSADYTCTSAVEVNFTSDPDPIVLTEADAAADLAGEPRPDHPSTPTPLAQDAGSLVDGKS